MKILYLNEKVKKYCTDVKAATKLFGGNKPLAISLMARITAIDSADTLMDIIKTPSFHFHNLVKKKGSIINSMGLRVADIFFPA